MCFNFVCPSFVNILSSLYSTVHTFFMTCIQEIKSELGHATCKIQSFKKGIKCNFTNKTSIYTCFSIIILLNKLLRYALILYLVSHVWRCQEHFNW